MARGRERLRRRGSEAGRVTIGQQCRLPVAGRQSREPGLQIDEPDVPRGGRLASGKIGHQERIVASSQVGQQDHLDSGVTTFTIVGCLSPVIDGKLLTNPSGDRTALDFVAQPTSTVTARLSVAAARDILRIDKTPP